MVKKGLIRKDFFYRIYIIPIYLPPLRERKEDIPLLVEHFLKKLGSARKVPPLTGSMIESLTGYDWPGNVRELENTLQRFVNLDDLDFLDFSSQKSAAGRKILIPKNADPELSLNKAVKRFEREYILQVLDKYDGNKSKVARFLEIGRKTLYMKMNSLGIEY